MKLECISFKKVYSAYLLKLEILLDGIKKQANEHTSFWICYGKDISNILYFWWTAESPRIVIL